MVHPVWYLNFLNWFQVSVHNIELKTLSRTELSRNFSLDDNPSENGHIVIATLHWWINLSVCQKYFASYEDMFRKKTDSNQNDICFTMDNVLFIFFFQIPQMRKKLHEGDKTHIILISLRMVYITKLWIYNWLMYSL